jgi:hypothetical protein
MKNVRMTICLLAAVLFMTASQGFDWTQYKDGFENAPDFDNDGDNQKRFITIYIGDAQSAVSSEERESVNELFTDTEQYVEQVEQYVEQAEDEVDSTIVRSRYVLVNFDYLKESETIVVNLFNDVSVTAVRDRIEKRSESRYTWFGQVPGRGYTSVILTVENGDMAGYISINGKVYQVRPLGNEIHVVSELNPCAFCHYEPNDVVTPPDLYPDSNTVPGAQYDAAQELQFDDGSTIDVMVVYTDDVARASGNIGAEIQLAIDQANQTYENSGIYQRLRLVHTAEVNYEETGNSNIDLSAITDCYDGKIDEVCTWRDTYRADIVSFLVLHMADWCGMGWGPWDLSGSPVSSSYAFSVVKRECATDNYSFVHELGHNMGAGHDVHAPSHSGSFPYSHGYTWDAWLGVDHFAYMSIMAYPNWCLDHWEIYSCPRIGYWSNPNISFRVCAEPFGWPCTDYYPFGYEDTVDNHRTLNETAYEVANFKQSNLPPVCVANGPYFAECGGATTEITLSTGSSDPDDDILTYSWTSDCPGANFDDNTSPTPTLMVDTSNGCNLICNVFLTVIDEVGLSDKCETTVTIQDTTPPDFELSVFPVVLWPPNHKMVKITPNWIASDICDPKPEVSLVSITINESGKVFNDFNDMQITGDGSIYLRASRSGESEGRIYTLTYKACDCSGNCTIQSATVTVPHDNSEKNRK